jgi:hypothetical protein
MAMQLAAGSTNTGTSLLRLPLTALVREPSSIRTAVYSFRRQVETEVMSRGGGELGVGIASKIHTACVALRRHLAIERKLRLLADSLTLEQWQGLVDRSVRMKEATDRCLSALGLDVRPNERSWYDRLFDEQLNPPTIPPAAANGQIVAEDGPPASREEADKQNDQGMTLDAAAGQPDALPPATEGTEQ